MPLQLKIYQKNCLQILERFFRRVVELNSSGALAQAFSEFTGRDHLKIEQLPEMPYICLRLPTGGGKTILAAHAVGITVRELLRQERGLVLWLAPTRTIVDQTLTALNDRRHPYREALDTAFGGNVIVTGVDGALYLQRSALDGNTVVIVSTLASLRITDPEGRKFYEANGSLMPHFTGLEDRQIRELVEGGNNDPSLITPSLANALRLRHPIVIMDEAHNARTHLSFDTLQRFAPSCVIELTATPETVHKPQSGQFASNVLHHVSALELKEEAMIKLPIRLRCQPDWKQAIQEAVARQAELESLAQEEQKATGEYIRPIVLLQAQNESEAGNTITPETVKQALIDDFKIPADQIAIATGRTDEIDGVNVLAAACPLRFIITIQKLKEGWDCPFAYVLCSLSSVSTRTAVEQILGRVLRQPHATKKLHDGLNCAYAIIAESSPFEAAQKLTELLEECAGFSKFEASIAIESDTGRDAGGPLFSHLISVNVQSAPDFSTTPVDIRAKVSFDPTEKTLTWQAINPPTEAHLTVLQRCFPKEADKAAVAQLAGKAREKQLAPAAQGQLFSVPQLVLRQLGEITLFEDQFRETDWKIAQKDPNMNETEFAISTRPTQIAILDVDKAGHMETNFVAEIQQQLSMFERGPTTSVEMVSWLCKNIKSPDLLHPQKATFLNGMVQYLLDKRGMTLQQLVVSRFALLDAAARKIDTYRRTAMRESYQQFLQPQCATPLEVTPEICFTFPLKSVYPATQIYTGPIRFTKHYYQNIAQMNSEESLCAVRIDKHPLVKFWVRNLTRPDFAFWLPTSTDRFYPDFVAQLNDGRFLAVEYKGEGWADSADTEEKTQIGQLWELRSQNQCLFRLLTKETMEPQLNALT